MFDDDMLFAGAASTDEWSAFHLVLTNFGAVSGLIMNKEKSELIFDRLDGKQKKEIASLFGVKLTVMFTGFRYLGFLLKPTSYVCQDWDLVNDWDLMNQKILLEVGPLGK